MNAEFRASLAQDLRKSGFYSEMMAIHACRAAKWECHGSFTYFDKDERETRECDFEAVKEWANGEVQVIARIVAQVKKSEKPWIVFMDRQPAHSRFVDGWDNIIHTSAMDRGDISNALRRRSLMERNGWSGTGIHEAFKKPTDISKWYSAFVTVCKASESALDASIAAFRPEGYFELIKPVIVLDGILAGAEVSPEGELILTKTDTAAFAFEYRSDAYGRPRYYVDVITLAAFPRYLDFWDDRMTAVTDALVASRSRR